MENVIVRIVNQGGQPLPAYATPQSAGMDLYANLSAPIVLGPLERTLIPTGLHVELPIGFEAQVRPRSGLALKKGLGLVNSPGTIDADYRGEIGVLVVNLSNTPLEIAPGERIAQLVVARYATVQWQVSDHLSPSDRGQGGFGSTGTHGRPVSTEPNNPPIP
ncbi:dUTP diphosphatase [bacterium]|nr:dUTP diphosphatase [bacterium]